MIGYYAIYSSHTPLRDVSGNEELWGGYRQNATYELLSSVLLAEYKYYSFGPALAPGPDVPTESPGGQWRGPVPIEEYLSDPSQWPEVEGVIDAGTRLQCSKLKRRKYLLHDLVDYAVFAKILDGPFSGRTVEITELSSIGNDGLPAPDQLLLKKTEGIPGSNLVNGIVRRFAPFSRLTVAACCHPWIAEVE